MTDLTLVIGDIEAARLVCDQLRTSGANLVHLLEPTDRELTNLTDQTWAAVAIVVRSDEHALRYALLVEHLQPGVRLVVTVFGSDGDLGKERHSGHGIVHGYFWRFDVQLH